MKRFKRPRFWLVYPLLIGLFLWARTTELQFRTAIPLILLGVFVRCWANGYTGHLRVNRTSQGQQKIGRFTTGGPYAHVRHPLYVGSFLIGTGFCVLVGSGWFMVLGMACLFWAYRKKVCEEERDLALEWPTEFSAYQKAVPRWIPTWRRYPHAVGQWCWAGMKASREFKTIIWVTVLLIALYFREEVFQEHENFFQKQWFYRLLLLLVGLALMATDAVFELHRRRVKRSQNKNISRGVAGDALVRH